MQQRCLHEEEGREEETGENEDRKEQHGSEESARRRVREKGENREGATVREGRKK